MGKLSPRIPRLNTVNTVKCFSQSPSVESPGRKKTGTSMYVIFTVPLCWYLFIYIYIFTSTKCIDIPYMNPRWKKYKAQIQRAWVLCMRFFPRWIWSFDRPNPWTLSRGIPKRKDARKCIDCKNHSSFPASEIGPLGIESNFASKSTWLESQPRPG